MADNINNGVKSAPNPAPTQAKPVNAAAPRPAQAAPSPAQQQAKPAVQQAAPRPAQPQQARPVAQQAAPRPAQPQQGKPVGTTTTQTVVKPGQTTTTTETIIRPGVKQTVTRTTTTKTIVKPGQPGQAAQPAAQASQEQPQQIVPDVKISEDVRRPKKKTESKLVRFFKNKFTIFVILLIIFGLSTFFLLLLDKENIYRPDWLNSPFFRNLGALLNGGKEFNVHFSSWFLLFLIWFVVLYIFAIFFLLRPSKEAFAKKHDLNMDDPQDRRKFRKLYTIYYICWFIFAALCLGIFFAVFPMGMINWSLALDPLINVLQSTGIFLLLLLFIPLCIAILVLIFKFIVFLLSLLIGSVSKHVMASSSYQEASATSQAIAQELKEEMLKKQQAEEEAEKEAAQNNSNNGNGGNGGNNGGNNGGAVTNSTLGGHQKNMFPALTKIDEYFGNRIQLERMPTEKTDLVHLVNGFQSFLANRKKLYYELDMLRSFVAGLASSRLLLLQGLSGTGKSTLPREFAEYTRNSATFYPVQATWRDKSDLVGYFSDFTGEYKETELLKTIYKAQYAQRIMYLLVLDEANISRVEYYFADFLSIYEYPSQKWLIPLLQPRKDDTLPSKLEEGKVRIPVNTWFIATVNIDDSTFTISDKVYDRATVLDFNALNEPIKTNYTDLPYPMTKAQFDIATKAAKDNEKNHLTAAEKAKFMKLIYFVADTFDVKIGNRIMNQIENFVPVFVACGGSKDNALDIMFANKVLRKVDALFESYVEEGLNKLGKLIVSLYGSKGFANSNKQIAKLKKKFI